MIFRKLKHIKEIKDLEVYDDYIYIARNLIYKFIETDRIAHQCENCFFNGHEGVGCIDAPCGFTTKKSRKDRKRGYFKLIQDIHGGFLEGSELRIGVLTKRNEELQNRIEQLSNNNNNVLFAANRKVYLSGPMTALIQAGKEDEVIEMFEKAEKHLKLFGFEVVNPFNNGVDKNEPWIKHILADLALLDPCDCICYLHTWDLMQSSGSEMEKIVARKDKKIEIREELNEGNYRYILL